MSAGHAWAVAMIAAGACALGAPGGVAAAGAGDPEAGRAVFAAKHCARCHRPQTEAGKGPALERIRRPQGEMELAGRLWNHVPEMLGTLEETGLAWPSLSASEMTHLMAYLQADVARDRAPDLSKGQLVLLRKNCLKCHSLRREGGRIEPDLSQHRRDYESPAAWAAAMWTHTPRMAALGRQMGVPYPRFAGDEMGNLVGFLKEASVAQAGGRGPQPRR